MSGPSNNQSPHLSHLEQLDSASNTSSSPQPGYAAPYMMSDPSKFSYPIPSSQQQGPIEPYQQAQPNPQLDGGPNNSVNLPPLRLQPHPSQAQEQQPHMAHQHMGSPTHGPTVPSNVGYYTPGIPPPQPHMGVTSSPHGPGAVYGGQADLKMISGGRHKKEIKRRTKTGCLTCRKRRIKCDETHPVCRNCQKSKRPCEGYDPMHRGPQQTSPAAIQPAPQNSQLSPFTPTNSNYGISPFTPPLPTGASSPGSSAEPYDYNSAIDPALAGTMAAQDTASTPKWKDELLARLGNEDGTVNVQYRPQPQPELTSAEAALQKKLLGAIAQINTGATEVSHMAGTPLLTRIRINIDDVINSDIIPTDDEFEKQLLLEPDVPTDEDADQAKHFYMTTYSKHLDIFFGTNWYRNFGTQALLADVELYKRFRVFRRMLLSYVEDKVEPPKSFLRQETRLVAHLIRLCESVTEDKPSYAEAQETAKYVSVLFALISRQQLKVNPVPYTLKPADATKTRARGYLFWSKLSDLLLLNDDDFALCEEWVALLDELRNILDLQEERDILYSLIIVRYVYFHQKSLPKIGGATSEEMMKIANSFLERTAKDSVSNRVTSRICDLAYVAYSIINCIRETPEETKFRLEKEARNNAKAASST